MVRMEEESSILDFERLIAVRVGVPEHLVYLLHRGKVFTGSSSLELSGVLVDFHVHMCARMHGGKWSPPDSEGLELPILLHDLVLAHVTSVFSVWYSTREKRQWRERRRVD